MKKIVLYFFTKIMLVASVDISSMLPAQHRLHKVLKSALRCGRVIFEKSGPFYSLLSFAFSALNTESINISI